MTRNITAAAVAAILLASAGAASAQTSAHLARTNVQSARTSTAWQSPSSYYNSYYNKDYWDSVAPAGRIGLRDPFAGTYFEGVVPY
jgi:hypothetical protein